MALLSAFGGDEAIDRKFCGGTHPRSHPTFGALRSPSTNHINGEDDDANTYTHTRGVFFLDGGTEIDWTPHASSRQSASGDYYFSGRFYPFRTASEVGANQIRAVSLYDTSGNEAWRIDVLQNASTDTTWGLLVYGWDGAAFTLVATLANCLSDSGSFPDSFIEFTTNNNTAGSCSGSLWVIRGSDETGFEVTWTGKTVTRKAECAPTLVNTRTVGKTLSFRFRWWDVQSHDSSTGTLTGRITSGSPPAALQRDNAAVYSYYPNRDGVSGFKRVLSDGVGNTGRFCLVDDHEDTGPATRNAEGIQGLSSTDEQELYFDLPGVSQPDAIYGVCVVIAFGDSSNPALPSEIGITANGESETVYTTATWKSSQDGSTSKWLWLPLDKTPGAAAWTWSNLVGTKLRIKGVTGLITAVRLNVLGDYDIPTPAGEGGTDVDRMTKNRPCRNMGQPSLGTANPMF